MKANSPVRFVVAALAGLWSAHAFAASDPYVGVWTKNIAESIGMVVQSGSETVEIRRHDPVLDFTWTGIGSDGKKETFSYTGKADGKERPLPGDAGLRGEMVRTPSGVIESKLWSKDGSLEDKFCILSAPGKQTCFATFTDRAGTVSLFKEVFDRVQAADEQP